MAKSVQKITLSASRDIPFDRLVLSQSNVRRIKAGVSIEELAADIARRTLLQSITVRPVLDEQGAETGMFEIPAGGRRYRALELLVKQKRLAKSAPIPCVVRTDGIAEEDSLAENVQRAPLHPLDQFRAFLALREKGQTEEEIAAAFFVAVSVVKQRLRLASVSPALLDVYAEDEMTLDQLMAFSVSPDHERQQQVWKVVQRSYNKEPYQIRRLLTEGSIRASDKRAQYAGAEYIAAGGPVMRDLFQGDDGGWFDDAGLLQRLAAEKLERDAETIRAEGWKWVETAIEFPYGHSYGMRLIASERRLLSDEKIATVEGLRAEAEGLEEQYADADEIPEEVDQRLQEIEAQLEAIHDRPAIYDPADVARSGTFVSIDGSGKLRVQRGYVRPEDEALVEEPIAEDGTGDAGGQGISNANGHHIVGPHDESYAENGSGEPLNGSRDVQAESPEEDDGTRPISDKLLAELTAYRTLALREAIGNDPGLAFLALVHVLTLKLFYRYGANSCLEIDPKSVAFGNQAPGLADTPVAAKVDARHEAWAQQLPEEPGDLWQVLQGFDHDSRDALFAHCVSLTINAVYETYNRRPSALVHATCLAEAVSLDIAETGWVPTADNYLGRVSKAHIVEAVREAKGDQAANAIAALKKAEMVTEAERLLAGTGWLPAVLRTPSIHRDMPNAISEDNMSASEKTGANSTRVSESLEVGVDEPMAQSSRREIDTSPPQTDAYAAD